MNPSELTVAQVRTEIETIITNYPNNTGSLMTNRNGYEDSTYVYYTEEDGTPVDFGHHREIDDVSLEVLHTPICIVGRWVEDFHPEYKAFEPIRNVLLRNSPVSTVMQADNPFSIQVLEALMKVQITQDRTSSTWGEIDLDVVLSN